MGALASTLMPSGTPVARAMRSVTTARQAAVSGPMSSGLRERDVAVVLDDQAMQAALDQGLGVAQAGVVGSCAMPAPR